MNLLCPCRSLSGALLLTALCGLFSVPTTHAEEDVRRATPPPGKALVFVFRVDPKPLAAQVPVFVNTVLVGELAHGTFITTTVGPGRNYLRIGDGVQGTLVVEANQSYFVQVKAIAAQNRVRSEIQLVSESEGRQSLGQSRLAGVAPAATASPPQTPPPPIAAAPPPKPPPAAATAAPPPKPPPAASTAAPPSKPPIVAAPPAQQPSDAAAPAARQPTADQETSPPPESGGNWDFALIANAGTFDLANSDQVVAGLARTYETTSKSVFGVEAEWRHKAGFAVGGEVFSYKNDLGPTGASPNAQQEVLAIMLNAKYFFRAASWLYPFVGAGIGQTTASYSGGLTGKATGLAYQGLAGIEFRFNQIGLNVQYKNLASKTGASGAEVKVGGSGFLAGVSIRF